MSRIPDFQTHFHSAKQLRKVKPPPFDAAGTANWKGYRAQFEIRDSKLFLRRIAGRIDGEKRKNDEIIAGENFPIVATWYTGRIHIAVGDFDDEAHEMTAVIILDVEKGIVKSIAFAERMKPVSTWNGLPSGHGTAKTEAKQSRATDREAPKDSNRKPPPPAELEAKLLRAVADRNGPGIDAVGAAILLLTEEQRRQLKFRVRAAVVEFRFDGTCPGHDSVEFLLSNKNRDYESLLVLENAELQRAAKVWTAAKTAKATRPPSFELKLLWVEKGKPHCEDLEDAFRKSPPPKQQKDWYYSQLDWKHDGLRIPNITLDQAAIPRTAQAAQFLVILRRPLLSK